MKLAIIALAIAASTGAMAFAPPATIRAHCVLMGDSIAAGLSAAAPECLALARSGITSGGYFEAFAGPIAATTTVISLGTNDSSGDTLGALRAVRARVTSDQVVWLRPPVDRRAQTDAVERVAAEHGDRVLDIRTESRLGDGIHPAVEGYQRIAKEVFHVL